MIFQDNKFIEHQRLPIATNYSSSKKLFGSRETEAWNLHSFYDHSEIFFIPKATFV